MRPIGPPDLFAVRAAEGWLALGDVGEARAELERVSGENTDHPQVLDVRWQVAAMAGDWRGAHRLAVRMVALHPELVAGWIHRSYAARRMDGGGLEAALGELLPAAERFPEEPMVAFNLACYLAQSGAADEAWRWFVEACRRGDADAVRKAALADEDLRPLWSRIRAG